MVHVPIEQIAKYGINTELPAHQLPLGAWSNGRNVRFRKNRAERVNGWANVMDPPEVAPAFIMNVDNNGDSFWLYASAIGAGSKVYAFNSGSHADISNSGDYNVPQAYNWNGGTFQGIPFLNHGQGVPQYWPDFNLTTDLDDLSDWPANTTAKILRVFDVFMVALDITDSNGAHIHRVLWSDGAAPGTLPSSWDVDDPAVEANHRDLSDTDSGAIQDGMQLRDMFVIYKQQSTWNMRYIGGQSIMDTKQTLQKSGLLCPRAVTPLTLPQSGTQVHFLHNGIDIGVYDGQTFTSVVDRKLRRTLNNMLDPIHYRNAYMVDNFVDDEVVFAFPSNGNSKPDVALVWNYREGQPYIRDFVGTFAAVGLVESASVDTWATVSGTWASQGPAKWQEGTLRQTVIADQMATKLQQLGGAADNDGVGFEARIIRRGLAVAGVDEENNPIVDMNSRKLVTRVWPRITNGPIMIRIGGEDYIESGLDIDENAEDNITWLDWQVFDPVTTGIPYADFVINTRFVAIEIKTTAEMENSWRLSGYAIDLEIVSEL